MSKTNYTLNDSVALTLTTINEDDQIGNSNYYFDNNLMVNTNYPPSIIFNFGMDTEIIFTNEDDILDIEIKGNKTKAASEFLDWLINNFHGQLAKHIKQRVEELFRKRYIKEIEL